VDANAAERPERSGSALDGSALDAKERAARRAAELEEEARKRVERLLSARGTGTPEAAAAAARPTRGGAPTPVPKTLSLSQRLGTGTGTAGTAGSVPDLDVPGTLALAEAIAETRRATTSAVRDVHVEILRQMHEMREAQTEMFRERVCHRGARRVRRRDERAVAARRGRLGGGVDGGGGDYAHAHEDDETA
jgi:hypothetical protein